MKRIFLDIGANTGQTIDFALRKEFQIDLIYGFEPSPICLSQLNKKYHKNPKVVILPFGLWTETCEIDLHNEGSQGGTILEDYKTTCNPTIRVTKCQFVCASDWFRNNIIEKCELFLKMNCEGSECDIVNNLLDSGEYDKVTCAFIDYDVRKSNSVAHKEKQLKERLKQLNINNLKVYMGSSRHLIMVSKLRVK
ncbi:hypothetical protein LCGC14_1296950 [marine sediment metagenome]|uniref:Methyltransferase FkbM domain-containing protein n=1 Tax=marine sediment metagenome TaxID=412755 RepID=A0A0F9KSI8_9ZZZZ